MSTSARFAYTPTEEEIKKHYAKKHGKSFAAIKGTQLPEEDERASKEALIEAEKNMPYSERSVEGDASETGLIRFAQLVMDIEETRAAYPIAHYQKNDKKVDAKIPFSSETKFNLFVRDLNMNVLHPTNENDNMIVVMKGAPERIINRCSKILVKGQEVEFNEFHKADVEKANLDLGKLGERVLALAICKLDPSFFTKDPAYPFDIETWKTW
jgi:magnesium-transporting ATPase (P-type)